METINNRLWREKHIASGDEIRHLYRKPWQYREKWLLAHIIAFNNSGRQLANSDRLEPSAGAIKRMKYLALAKIMAEIAQRRRWRRNRQRSRQYAQLAALFRRNKITSQWRRCRKGEEENSPRNMAWRRREMKKRLARVSIALCLLRCCYYARLQANARGKKARIASSGHRACFIAHNAKQRRGDEASGAGSGRVKKCLQSVRVFRRLSFRRTASTH
jgi:hypothetical protein